MSVEQPYPWYKDVDNSFKLSQGDILFDCPAPVMKPDKDTVFKVGYITIPKVIIMTQSCDMENDKVDEVAVCPIVPLPEVLKVIIEAEMRQINFNEMTKKQRERKQDIVDDLKKGTYLDYYLIDKIKQGDKTLINYHLVQLRSTFFIPIEVLNNIYNIPGKRFRILPPYREHLAQAYARNYMRIGLPIDINIDAEEIPL